MKERAIVTFVEDKIFLIIEIFNLYSSCLISEIKENTDLIICAPKSMWHKLPKDDSFIIYLDTNSISENCDSKEDKNCNLAWKGYHFVNSISCLVIHEKFLSRYKYILKTDCDVFLTQNFKNFWPKILYTGTGGYVNDEDVKKRLKDISKKKGYKHQGKFNVGATWYGDGNLILNVSKLTLKILENILNNNFKIEGKWPGWYRGVASMYASEIAVNHLVENFEISKLFDGRSDSDIEWKKSGVYHIHCWHCDNIYSKHAFIQNKYDNINPESLNSNKTNDYCLKIALSNLNILHSLQKSENYEPKVQSSSLRNVYNDILNNKDIDHYYLFNCKNNVYKVFILFIYILILGFIIYYLIKKKL
jgi:hypothetical protein